MRNSLCSRYKTSEFIVLCPRMMLSAWSFSPFFLFDWKQMSLYEQYLRNCKMVKADEVLFVFQIFGQELLWNCCRHSLYSLGPCNWLLNSINREKTAIRRRPFCMSAYRGCLSLMSLQHYATVFEWASFASNKRACEWKNKSNDNACFSGGEFCRG